LSRRIKKPETTAARSSDSSFSAVAHQYAANVVSGKVVACKLVIAACQRHLEDLQRTNNPSFGYRFDPAKAEKACRFIERLPHVKGKWASRRETIKLAPWQVFIVCCLFGWVSVATGCYRFREAYIKVSRKNAKSTLSAGIGLYKFAADGEYGAEVYSGATTKKQAWEVFRPARHMVERTQLLRETLGIRVNAESLVIGCNGSRFEPVIGKPGDGASPSCAIVDEYHEHTSDDLYDTMKTGMGARDNPLLLVITTAGSDRSGPCYALEQDAIKLLEGKLRNEEWFCIIYTIDDGDDWKSKPALLKANPNYDISVFGDYLERQQRDAINSARKQNTFKTKHLDIWVGADVAWLSSVAWNKCADSSLKLEDFLGQRCMVALDLASRKDIASRVLMFRKVIEGKNHYYVFAKHYLNEFAIEQSKGNAYSGWEIDGWIAKTPGNTTSYVDISKDLIEDSKRFEMVEVPHDPYHAAALVQFIQADPEWVQSAQFVEVRQLVGIMSPAMKEFEAIVLEERFHHNGDPVLDWMVSNVVCHTDRKGNIFPTKQNQESKIDGAICLFMDLIRWMANTNIDGGSVYDQRGILTL
jgi:phage terminase large subunit-like protein